MNATRKMPKSPINGKVNPIITNPMVVDVLLPMLIYATGVVKMSRAVQKSLDELGKVFMEPPTHLPEKNKLAIQEIKRRLNITSKTKMEKEKDRRFAKTVASLEKLRNAVMLESLKNYKGNSKVGIGKLIANGFLTCPPKKSMSNRKGRRTLARPARGGR